MSQKNQTMRQVLDSCTVLLIDARPMTMRDAMRSKLITVTLKLGIALLIIAGCSGAASAQWTGLANGFPAGHTFHCLLLTDGTVMCHEYGTNHWHRLVPDQNGSYQNGQWDPPGKAIADMPNGTDTSNVNGTTCAPCTYGPTFYASAVLPDGRVVIIGGEYNTNSNATSPATAVWTNIGFLYDPVTNSWSSQIVEPFGTGNVGDAQTAILPNGTLLMANISANGTLASFNPNASPPTFTTVVNSGVGKDDQNDEENWNILPNGKILTVDARIAQRSEVYNPATNSWETAVDTQVNLADTGAGTGNSAEVGPAVLRPDGTLIAFSGNPFGQNAVYNTTTGTWATTANFPCMGGPPCQQFAVKDGPATLLPNGNVLVMASPVTTTTNAFNSPSHFFEFDGTNLTQVADSPNAASFASYQGQFLLLPTGEVLLTAFDQNNTADLQLYSNGGGPQDAWRPVITSGPHVVEPGHSYFISGKLFNGFSEGASYGDNAQMSTNYPLVRITNRATGHVFYARTHDHNRMGVEAVGSNEIITTQMDTPSDLETGLADLVVVANGIPSLPLVVNGPVITVPGDVTFPETCVGTTSTATLNVCNTGQLDLTVNSIASNNSQFTVTTPSSGFPVNISPDFCFPFQVKFTPTSTGQKTASFTINSNDPNNPNIMVQASGNGTQQDIRVTGSTTFGDVCAGEVAETTISVCNVGACDLHVSSATISCPDFSLINNPFPATVSPDSCLNLTIRFTPTSPGPKSCTLTITSDDPDMPVINQTVTANTPAAAIDVPPDQSFLPEVIQSEGSCRELQPFPISNTGTCNLIITNITIGGVNATDFGLSGLPSFPIILQPGHTVGDGNLMTVFAPTEIDRDRLGTLRVTYVSNPISGATTTVTRDLCGEGVRTGARVLVTHGGVPVPFVEKLQLQRINGNRNKKIVDTVDNAMDLLLVTVTPTAPCAPFQYHREYGTVSNPIQLLPGSYQVTATAIIDGKRQHLTVAFDVDTCDFNPTVVVDFP